MYQCREAHGFATVLIRTLSVTALACISAAGALSQGNSAPITLYGHVPPIVAVSQAVGRAPASERVDLALTLPLRNQAGLDDLLARLHDPHDPLYGKYLTPAEFAER